MSSTEKPKQNKVRTFQMRVDDEFFKLLDEYRRSEPDLPNRAQAIRRLVEKALMDKS